MNKEVTLTTKQKTELLKAIIIRDKIQDNYRIREKLPNNLVI